MIIINVEQGSEAWYHNRLGRFTASKFATLMSGDEMRFYDRFTAHGGCLLGHESLHIRLLNSVRGDKKYNTSDYYSSYKRN